MIVSERSGCDIGRQDNAPASFCPTAPFYNITLLLFDTQVRSRLRNTPRYCRRGVLFLPVSRQALVSYRMVTGYFYNGHPSGPAGNFFNKSVVASGSFESFTLFSWRVSSQTAWVWDIGIGIPAYFEDIVSRLWLFCTMTRLLQQSGYWWVFYRTPEWETIYRP
jgi:hypothetical protein